MAATGTLGLASPAAHASPAQGSSGDGSERSRVIGTPTLTAEHKRDLARKDAEASAMWREAQELRAAVESGAEVTASGKNVAAALADCPDGDCSWQAVLAITQHTQINSYYCGPAMLQSLVEARSVSISQGAAASALGTTTAGTDWYQGGGVYPVEDALDAYLGSHGANYAPVNLSGSPSGSEKSDFKSRLYANTNNNWAEVRCATYGDWDPIGHAATSAGASTSRPTRWACTGCWRWASGPHRVMEAGQRSPSGDTIMRLSDSVTTSQRVRPAAGAGRVASTWSWMPPRAPDATEAREAVGGTGGRDVENL